MNNQTVAISPDKASEIIEAVIAKGDLAQLSPLDRARYYRTVCESIGLNPLTKPFEYITLNGKLTLYARKDCTDQLRKIYGVSVDDMSEKREADLIIVTVKVRDKSGRSDMSKGAVNLKSLSGEALANAIMKAETKAKRRATLSICGLGFLDETEVETISNAHTPRLPKKDARDIYSRLQAEVDECADIEDWLLKNEGRLLVLPEDWENILRLRIQERQQTPIEPAEVVIWNEESEESPPEWSSKWDALGPVKQAGVLCHDGTFWKFLSKTFPESYVDNESAAAVVVRDHCGVGSRAALGTSAEAAKLWRVLVSEYRAWQREPEILHPVSPAITPAKSAAPSPPANPNGAADNIPTAAEYITSWNTILQGATSGDLVAKTWNEQAELRKQIEWPAGEFVKLQGRVKKAIEFLKAPAT